MTDDTYLDPDYLEESSKTNIEDYICCICDSIPNPETALEEENCGHLFCQNCLNNWLKKSKNCPFCKETISKRSIKDKNKIVYRHLINLIIICPETDCNWKGNLKEFDEHLINKHNKIKDSQDSKDFELYKYYKATCHEHPLKYLGTTMDNGWGCDGRKLPSKCFSGITGFKQTKDIKRFRCMQCDYDLCENCMNNYKCKNNYELNKSYKVNIHPHPLVFLGETKDNGWACDGRKLKDKCLSGINDFRQTNGFERFRCDDCDFDLCRNCMDYYYSHDKNCIIF